MADSLVDTYDTIESNWRDVPFAEAIKLLEKKEVVIPDVYYGTLTGLQKELAFSIANIEKVGQLQGVLKSLTKSMKDGSTFEEWKDSIDNETATLSDNRLDNIYRTNMQSMYNSGRWYQQTENIRTRPFVMYNAVNDSRVRPAHLANDGFICKIDDPVLKKIWFGRNVYRCRCKLVSLNERQAKERSATSLKDPVIAKDYDKSWDNVDVMNLGTVAKKGVKSAKKKILKNPEVDNWLKSWLKSR